MKSLVVGAGAGISAALMTALSKLGTNHAVQRTKSRSRFDSTFHREHWPVTVTSSRKTRNPADPAQAYLIARAEAKRARRAEKLMLDSTKSYFHNDTHGCSLTFDPHYIAQ